MLQLKSNSPPDVLVPADAVIFALRHVQAARASHVVLRDYLKANPDKMPTNYRYDFAQANATLAEFDKQILALQNSIGL